MDGIVINVFSEVFIQSSDLSSKAKKEIIKIGGDFNDSNNEPDLEWEPSLEKTEAQPVRVSASSEDDAEDQESSDPDLDQYQRDHA